MSQDKDPSKCGKPPHEPTSKTRSEVSALRSYGIPQEEVAAYIGIDAKTLRKYYRDELDKAAITANAKVGQFLYQNATGSTLKEGATHSDCVRAAMFWAKTRMGWRESGHLDITSEGEKIKSIDSNMTPEEAAAIYAETLHNNK